MRIDSHQHFWQLSRGDYGWLTPDLGPIYRDYGPDDLRPMLDKARIGRTVLVQAAPTVAESHFLLDIASRTDFVAGVVGWVDMLADDAVQQIDQMRSIGPLLGIRPMIQDVADDDWMLQPELDPVFQYLIEAGLRFDALVLPRHLKNLHILLQRYPDLRVVIDHAAKPFIKDGVLDPWREDIERLATDTSAFCKFSGLVTEAKPGCSAEDILPYADHLISVFGAERLMWGSDWPVVELAKPYMDWLKISDELLSAFSAEERQRVFGGTAQKFYGITTE